jgi:hypothetical protein
MPQKPRRAELWGRFWRGSTGFVFDFGFGFDLVFDFGFDLVFEVLYHPG